MSLTNVQSSDRTARQRREQSGLASPTLELESSRSRCLDHLPAALRMRLEELARAEQTTLFTLLLTAFQLLLGRHEASDEVVVGAPGDDEDALAGLHPYRATLSGNPTFRELIAAVAPAVRDRGRPFRFAFALRDGRDAVAARDLDLAMNVDPRENGLTVSLRYRADLFDRSTIERLLLHYRTALETISAAPDRRASELLPLSEPERQEALRFGTGRPAVFEARCVHDLIGAQVRRTPDATAVVFAHTSITYRQLEQRANRLAHQLIAAGVGANALVGVCLERSIEMVVAILGIWKAGGAYVPLDPQYPADRLSLMVKDAELSVIVVDDAGAKRLPDGAWTATHVDAALAGADHRDPRPRSSVDDLAYVIYTSGSTGKPKGVMIEHRSLANHIAWMRDTFDLGPQDAVLQKTSVSFDASVCEFLAPLVTGGRLVLASPGSDNAPEAIVALCREHAVTVVQFVPSALTLFADADGVEELACLRHLVAAGEALPTSLAKRVRERLPRCAVHNLYGPSEATIDTTSYPFTDDDTGVTVPIGRPISNVRVLVVDEHTRLVPVGVPGELLVGGLGLSRGYLRRPDLTAEKFIVDPIGSDPGVRWYRTGDLVRWRPDGVLVFLGRIDQQVKLRGFRIEPEEIEALLLLQETVADATVMLRDDHGDPRLVAYLVARDSARLSAPELRAQLSAQLPSYMVPAAFVVLPALPLTANGKLDRQALPAPAAADTGRRASCVPPRDELELELVELWQQMLGVEPVGIDDDFFALGGSSLVAMRLVARLRAAHSVNLKVRSLFAQPTVAGLAGCLRQLLGR
jgi:amino acid adenylation domain-containing protein